ncbi:MAG: DUF1801 domain-containing protein [Saprospiraceae bacterium]|nr:DUF1801 domain-containing protein [Saprospiraceae bacterium]
MNKNELSREASDLLDTLQLSNRAEIDLLRTAILGAMVGIAENVKWNSPNFSFQEEDRITMRVQPPGKIQLILHRGAKKLEQPKERLIQDSTGLLEWKENDRAVITFKKMADVGKHLEDVKEVVRKWVEAAII